MAAKSELESQSVVWRLFPVEKAEDECAIFNICKRGEKRGQKEKGLKSYSTALLHNHLKHWHTTEFNSTNDDFKKKKKEADVSGSLTPMQRKLKGMQSTLQGRFAARNILGYK